MALGLFSEKEGMYVGTSSKKKTVKSFGKVGKFGLIRFQRQDNRSAAGSADGFEIGRTHIELILFRIMVGGKGNQGLAGIPVHVSKPPLNMNGRSGTA